MDAQQDQRNAKGYFASRWIRRPEMTPEATNALDNMLRAVGVPDTDPGAQLVQPVPPPGIDNTMIMEALAMTMQQMETGLLQLAQEQHTIGIHLDATRLTVGLLVNMLVEKGIIQKAEWDAAYKVNVVDRLQEFQRQMREKARQQLDEARKAETPPEPKPPAKEEPPDEAAHSDVVLPSERGGVMVFK